MSSSFDELMVKSNNVTGILGFRITEGTENLGRVARMDAFEVTLRARY